MTGAGRMKGEASVRAEGSTGAMSGGVGMAAAGRAPGDRAYLLDVLGDCHRGLGRYEAAIEAYQQASQLFAEQGARCSHALCLFKIAESYLDLEEPWHAVGYLEACLPLLRDLRLARHQVLAQRQLDTCHAGLAHAGLLEPEPDAARSPLPLTTARPA
jgi:tetratricopeptide (TPR) repeat protein